MAINQLQKGATLERTVWMAKLRRLAKANPNLGEETVIRELLFFGKLREKRTNKKPGGL